MTERVTVLIERDTSTRIPATVYDFAVPVLEAIHGPGVVSVIDSKPCKDVDLEAEHDRLRSRYGDGPVLAIYPNGLKPSTKGDK